MTQESVKLAKLKIETHNLRNSQRLELNDQFLINFEFELMI